MEEFTFPITPVTKAGQHRIIRVHSAKGTVYARIMEPMSFPGEGIVYAMIDAIDVPAGLTQQGTVDHFRAQGWTVQQDNGTDFDNPEWGE